MLEDLSKPMNKQGDLEGSLAWYRLERDQLPQELGSDLEAGLTDAEAQRRLADYGPNELPEAPPPSLLKLFASQFSSLIIWVLIGAAIISGLLQEWVDAAAIIAIVILNAILGFVQEFRAERSLAALRKLSAAAAVVIRGGTARTIAALELVPGDLIQLEAGDHVPADARLVYTTTVRTQEAALTGESTPVDKNTNPLSGHKVPLGDRRNMVFLGTAVTTGKARALVVSTGLKTELGRIAAMMEEAKVETTPLQRRLEQLGHVLLYLTLGIVIVVFLLGLFRGFPLATMFLTAVTLAVAAIPEGLPAIVTITLALGVTRMVKRNALIRRLPAVETLGSTTVICTDKTGTLTKNEMTVTRLFVEYRIFPVTGEGYAPVGAIQGVEPGKASGLGLHDLLSASVLCNGANLQEDEGSWRILGDPTEGALLVAAAKWSLWKSELEATHPFLGEVPFDSERKMMTVVRKTPSGPVAFVKGAPDVLLQRCSDYLTLDGYAKPLSDSMREHILTANAGFAQEALRVLAIARRPLEEEPTQYRADDLERNLTFLGLAAMKDPLRPEAKVAVQTCRQAGIRTVMITGDHRETAVSIARDLGLLNGTTQALSGTELDGLTQNQLIERVEQVAVYARVSAAHKLRIVNAWKTKGAIVAMTGDGVNDAPAIKAADIGVAMGLTGTDVTKEASAMVVTDDNFASIAAAVEGGRAIYDNIIKSVHFLLSCNIGEVLLMLLAILAGLPLPLMPVQILWINLVTDGFPALALAVDPAAQDLMERPPRRPKARIFERERMVTMFVQGSFMALITIGVFSYALYGQGASIEQARTVAFTALVLAQLFHAFNCRSDRDSLFTLGWGTNQALLWAVGGSALLQVGIISLPWTSELFKVAFLTPQQWLLVLAVGTMPLVAMEVWKRLRGKSLRGVAAE